MAIKKIKLPSNTTLDIHDARIPAPQSTDNGKVLGVTSAAGAMGWVEQSGGVTDVQVGGASVVSSGVAVITSMSSADISTAVDTAWNAIMS